MVTLSDKVRLRTPQELADRKRGFLELHTVLSNLGFTTFLCLGTLLGAVREQRFIPWDWDAELGVYTNDVFGRKEELVTAIETAGFKILKKHFSLTNFKLDVIKYQPAETTSFTIVGWKKDGEFWTRDQLRIPAQFFDTLDDVQFLEKDFKCPHNPEEYLTFQYGDWRTPKQTDDKDEYWTTEVFPKGDVTKGGRLGVLYRRIRKTCRKVLAFISR